MILTVKAIMVEAARIFVKASPSNSNLIILFKVRRVRVKDNSMDEPLTIARAFKPKIRIDGVKVRLIRIEAKFMIRTVLVLLYINSRLLKAGDIL